MSGKDLCVCTCAYLYVQARMVTCAPSMFIICEVVDTFAHIISMFLLVLSPQGLGSLVWVSCGFWVGAPVCVWSWGWCVEVVVLGVQ